MYNSHVNYFSNYRHSLIILNLTNLREAFGSKVQILMSQCKIYIFGFKTIFFFQNLVRASYVTYSGLLLSKYGKAALPGYNILLQHLCYTLDGLVSCFYELWMIILLTLPKDMIFETHEELWMDLDPLHGLIHLRYNTHRTVNSIISIFNIQCA